MKPIFGVIGAVIFGLIGARLAGYLDDPVLDNFKFTSPDAVDMVTWAVYLGVTLLFVVIGAVVGSWLGGRLDRRMIKTEL